MTLKAILLALGILGAPNATAPAVARGVASYARTPEEAAFTIAWGHHESGFSEAIAAGNCAKWQCDARRRADGTIVHLARGIWQSHERAAGSAWEHLPGNIDLQAFVAVRHARWALGRCNGDARCAFRLLGGLPRDRKLKGEDARVAMYRKALEAVR